MDGVRFNQAANNGNLFDCNWLEIRWRFNVGRRCHVIRARESIKFLRSLKFASRAASSSQHRQLVPQIRVRVSCVQGRKSDVTLHCLPRLHYGRVCIFICPTLRRMAACFADQVVTRVIITSVPGCLMIIVTT